MNLEVEVITGAMDDNKPVFFLGDEVLVRAGYSQGEQLFDDYTEGKEIVLGVCAMKKKSHSKPMHEILERLEKFMHIKTFLFDEDVILVKPIEEWPVVDVLISFFSSGFPLDKAIEYAKLRKSFMINDLEAQYLLLDRRNVYKTLAKEGIAHPRYAELNREDNGSTEAEVNDSDDSITVNNMVFQKPFVEKPVCAEDHRVYIYFPVSAGGGSQRLFRKVGSRSSVYSSESKIRKNGSYIYEDFMPTDGTDVKVYTVGPDYAHAEARKSPVLDGKVERDKNGKEIRYPVLLSAKEKLLARKVCLAFKQTVCGFDLLRANGQSYVCDVNGFSFVKNSVKYYDDCAKILGTMIMRALAPQLHIPWVLGSAPEDIPVVPTTSGSMMELRCVVAVIRHGDRTPKQKMKMEVKHKRFFDLFQKYDGFKTGHLKLKKPKQLQEVLDIARFLLTETKTSVDPELVEKEAKLQQLKLVLEMYGHFSGINRKVQLKYQPHGHPQRSSSEEDEIPREPSLLLIVKWGGELTPAGKIQAEGLGKAFRTLYPGGQGQFETPGLGFLRLHSTFRHDLKIYASDEGRVQMTAAAFTKGLLALEGELTPILVQMVKSANTNGLLDKQGETSKYQHVVKERLTHILNNDKELDDADYIKIAPTNNQSLLKALDVIKNPQRLCVQVHKMVKELTSKVKLLQLEHRTRDLKLYNGESWELLIRRWSKLEKDFKMKDGRFDVSKISDIYDCIKYDIQHNQKTLQYDKAQELFNASKALADIVIPQEYGITVDEKLHISQSICTPLMRKIRSDLQQCMEPSNDDESTRLNSKYSKGVASPERFVRTRLYFTSESHLHSLINMMKYGGLCDENEDEQWLKAVEYINATEELNYMTQIIIMMFEDPSKDPGSAERFHIELHFSPGAYIGGDKDHNFSVSKNSKQHFTKPSKPLDLEFTNTFKKAQERPVSAPMIIREQEEYEEFDIFDHGSKESHHMLEEILENSDEPVPKRASVPKKKIPVPEPQSPDPEIPEWDWGSDPEDKEKPVEDKKASKNVENSSSSAPGSTNDIHQSSLAAKSCSVPSVSTNSVSQPIAISPNPKSQEYLYEPVRSQSLDEKRSRSLEDKQPDPKPTPFVDRHYLTVHLPLPSDRQRYSCSSLFLLNADAFRAFEGFSMVPSLRPLETLHNRLTVKQLDSFLKRATTSKFVTPISSPPVVRTPLASPHVHVHKAARKAHSQPSSSNSSTGPSSPTSAVAPIMDAAVFKKLQKIVIDKQESKESDKFDITLVDNSDITLVNNSDVMLDENSDATLANKSEGTLVDDESLIT